MGHHVTFGQKVMLLFPVNREAPDAQSNI